MSGNAHPSEHQVLPRSLGLFRLTVYGVGTIIGSGIYAVISPAAQNAGPGIWIGFLIAAAISSFTALSYAELASALPGAGAEHNFLRTALPKFPVAAFIVGLFIAIHGAATVSAVALTFASYFTQIVDAPEKAVALVLIVGFTILNITGIKRATWINVAFTIIQVACLLALITGGFTTENFALKIQSVVNAPIDWEGTLRATAIIFFIYTGYEHMASMSEEAIEPGRDLWRAFLLSLIITTAIYVAIIFAVLGLDDAQSLGSSPSPLAAVAKNRLPLLGNLIMIGALLATANGVLSGSLSISRLLFGMARSGDLPASLMKTRKGSRSPWFAALIVMFAAGALISIGRLEIVASLSSFGALLVFTLVNAAVIILRFKKPNLRRPFRVPGQILNVPILPCLGMVFSLLLASRYKPGVYLIFTVGLLLGLGSYAINHRHRS